MKNHCPPDILLGTTSRTLLRIPFLVQFLGASTLYLRGPRLLWTFSGFAPTAMLGWGRRPAARVLRKHARSRGLLFISLEDGFLRSFHPGQEHPPLAMVFDDIGIYYDSTCHSALEALLTSSTDVCAELGPLVSETVQMLISHGLSKYNHSPDLDVEPPLRLRPAHECRSDKNYNNLQKILVVDQTIGDMSVVLGGANASTFVDMLELARSENPDATIYVKTHPEVASGRKGGYLTSVQPGIRTVVLRDSVNPMSLISRMDKVYVVTSTMGFEALLAGKPVVCFGVPWYAGWGVTDDRVVDSPAWARRTKRRSVDELFAAAYIHYTRYLDPVTHKRGTIFDVIHWLIRQCDMADRMHGKSRKGRVIGVGFRKWKAVNLKPMLGLHPEGVLFAKTATSAEVLVPTAEDTLVFWGADFPAGLNKVADAHGARALHVEDGFIRSVGLGSDLIRPLSLVLDERGIYFDATRPSDLEHMLATREFTDDDITRARTARAFIVEHGITKYNLEPRQSVTWPSAGRPVVLVPGQVEDDASIRLGCTTVKTNLGLLQVVRSLHPDAFIVYKPHPDVISRNRKGRVALAAARQYADHIESGVSVVSCIEACDEVHTMTSLAGFDALLRGKKVVTYGQPFYAGWGLTEDRAEQATAFARRQRRLTLDELVAGALLHYPVYWDWALKGYTTCEAVLRRIVETRDALEANGGLERLRVGFFRRQGRKLAIVMRAIWGDFFASR